MLRLPLSSVFRRQAEVEALRRDLTRIIAPDRYNSPVAIDVQQQVAYWSNGAREDFAVAGELLANRRTRHGMFFLHLSIEKMLKAHVSRTTRDIPPRTHNLLTLAQRATLDLPPETLAFLGDLDRFDLAGQYPDAKTPEVTVAEAMEFRRRAEEVMQCLAQALSQ